jgi:hypothetical protein
MEQTFVKKFRVADICIMFPSFIDATKIVYDLLTLHLHVAFIVRTARLMEARNGAVG